MKNDPLFELIKALSKTEKRYFKLFCNQTASAANHLRLFDAIDRQSYYDEASIRIKFKGEPFLKQLHVTKNYLRKLILKSLRNYHSQLSQDAELKEILRNVEILFHKELYTLCQAELKRAEALAKKSELQLGLLEVQIWQRKIAQTLHPQRYQQLAEIINAQASTLEALQNTQRYWQIAVSTSGTFMGQAWQKKVDESWQNQPGLAQTTEAKVLYFNTMYIYCLRQDEPEKAANQLHELIEYLEADSLRLSNHLGVYLSTIHNLGSFLVFQREFAQALELLRRGKAAFEQRKERGENQSLLKQMLRSCNIELEIYRSSGNFDENADFIAEAADFVQEYQAKMPEDYRLSFWFQLAYIAFKRQHYADALHWINCILNSKWKQARLDLQIQARMLNLMIHLEEQNLFVLRYFVDSTRRFYKKTKLIQPFEKLLLQFFSKMGQIPDYEYKDRFRQLYNTLFPAKGEAWIPENILRYIDYQDWIRSKFKTEIA